MTCYKHAGDYVDNPGDGISQLYSHDKIVLISYITMSGFDSEVATVSFAVLAFPYVLHLAVATGWFALESMG